MTRQGSRALQRTASVANHVLAFERRGSHGSIPPVVHDVLRSRGQSLDASTRAFMEPRFGYDFSQVRVHTDAIAANSAAAVNSLAYTVGSDITFAAGRYAPETLAGQKLLAHELAHVVQQRGGSNSIAGITSHPSDEHEVAADGAASTVLSGHSPEITGSGKGAILSRQPVGPLAPTNVTIGSQGSLIVETFLKRMWAKQSDQAEPFRVTPKVREGLNYIFPFGAPIGPLTIFKTPDELMDRLRGSIPATIDPNVIAVLDRLPDQEKKLSEKQKPSEEAAKPNLPQPSGASKPPETPKGYDEAAAKALEAAYEQFSKTELGKQLERSLKSYVLSAEGIPLDVIVAGTALTFVAANDPKVPGIPAIPIGHGIKIKIDYSGKATDLPPLVRALVSGHSQEPSQPGQSETKIGVSLTINNDEIAATAKAIGHFFAEAATWIAKGVVKVGTVIAKTVSSIKKELIGALGGGAIGALIGGLAGGGLGAAIGAGIGALAGLGAGLVADLLNRRKQTEATK